MSPSETAAFAEVVARFFAAGGTLTFREWIELDREEQAVFVAVRAERENPRAFPSLDRETSDAYERVLGVMGVPRG